MSYIIRVFLEDQIWNLDLETFDDLSIGSSPGDIVMVRELDEKQIRITRKQNGEYLISGLLLAKIENGVSSPVSEDLLEEDNLYRVSGGKTLELTVHPRQDNSTKAILLSVFDRIQIGRNRMKNDIVLSNKRTSSVHCEITRNGDSFFLRDLNSTNGTYLNNRLINPLKEEKLYDGDVICLSIYRLYFLNGKLFFFNTGEDLQLNIRSVELSETEETDLVYSLKNRKEEPGLIAGTTLQRIRAMTGEKAENEEGDLTQIGSEREVERMQEKERLQKESISDNEESENSDLTQIGSEKEIERMQEKESHPKELLSETEKIAETELTQTSIGTL